jgi:Zn finger protein HypA/HybF involved in hydrogenase expression
MTREYTFDFVLRAAVTVKAENADLALEMVQAVFECADCNGGAWPNGEPVLFEASLKQRPDIGLINGEDVNIQTLRQWAELRKKEQA